MSGDKRRQSPARDDRCQCICAICVLTWSSSNVSTMKPWSSLARRLRSHRMASTCTSVCMTPQTDGRSASYEDVNIRRGQLDVPRFRLTTYGGRPYEGGGAFVCMCSCWAEQFAWFTQRHCSVTSSSQTQSKEISLLSAHKRSIGDAIYIYKPVDELARALLSFKQPTRPHRTAIVAIISIFHLG